MLLLQDFQVLLSLIELDEILDSLIDTVLKALELIQCLVSEVFWWWLILLDTLKVTDNLFGTRLLFVNDALQIIKFFIDFLGDLIL